MTLKPEWNGDGLYQLLLRVKYLFLLLIILIFSSCGQIIGFDDFKEPDIGNVLKIESYFSEDNLVKFYNTVSKPEEGYVPCRTVLEGRNYPALMRVRGFTSRSEPKNNLTLKLIDRSGDEIPYALMTEAGTWMKNRIVMYAYNNYQYKGKSLTAAPETEAAAFFINDEYMGYYAKVDIYTQGQLEDLYDEGDFSELFKVHLDSYSEYPLYSKTEKKFPDDNDFSSFNLLISNVNNLTGTEWENWVDSYIDVDDFIRYMVVHDFFGVTDTEIQNFYIYNYGKMVILPWDNELGMDLNYSDFNGHNKLTERILEIPSIETAYETEINNFKDNVDFRNELIAKINQWYDESKKAVKNDPIFYYEFDDFTAMKNEIIYFLNNRHDSIPDF